MHVFDVHAKAVRDDMQDGPNRGVGGHDTFVSRVVHPTESVLSGRSALPFVTAFRAAWDTAGRAVHEFSSIVEPRFLSNADDS